MRRVRNDIRHVSDAIRGEQVLTMFPDLFPQGLFSSSAVPEVRLGPEDDAALQYDLIILQRYFERF